MRVFYFSDFHNDINNIENLADYIPDNADLYIDAGDTAGGLKDVIKFYEDPFWNNKRVLFIGGNHLAYDGTPLDECINILKNKFHQHNNVTFLENDYVKIDNTIFIGATLWTDFNCYGAPESGRRYGRMYMNDFKYIKYTDGIMLEPEHTERMHNYSLRYITKKLKKFDAHQVVLITHHAPSKLSVSETYKNSDLNPCFYSNLENIMLENNNLKLWIHGHIHSSSNYQVNKCTVLCNPLGYKMYEDDFITGYSKRKALTLHTEKKSNDN